MIKCSVYNENGEEIDAQIMQRGFRPKKGYQRLKSGNFAKWKGDPRCITEKIQMKLAKEEEEKKKRQEKYGVQNHSNRNYLFGQTTIYAQSKRSIEDIYTFFDNGCSMFLNGNITLINPKRLKKTGYWCIDKHEKFSYVQIDETTESVKIWINSGYSLEPDIIIADVLLK